MYDALALFTNRDDPKVKVIVMHISIYITMCMVITKEPMDSHDLRDLRQKGKVIHIHHNYDKEYSITISMLIS